MLSTSEFLADRQQEEAARYLDAGAARLARLNMLIAAAPATPEERRRNAITRQALARPTPSELEDRELEARIRVSEGEYEAHMVRMAMAEAERRRGRIAKRMVKFFQRPDILERAATMRARYARRKGAA